MWNKFFLSWNMLTKGRKDRHFKHFMALTSIIVRTSGKTLIVEWSRKSFSGTIQAVIREFIMQTVPLNNDSAGGIFDFLIYLGDHSLTINISDRNRTMLAKLFENRKFIELHNAMGMKISIWNSKTSVAPAKTADLSNYHKLKINLPSYKHHVQTTPPECCVSFENFVLFAEAPGDNFWNIFQLNILRLICCFQVFHQAKRRWGEN